MASRAMEMSLALALVSMLFAQQASSQSTSGCTAAIVSLSPCLGYITGNSSTPSSTCCSSLASVVSTQAQCLCTLVSGGGASQLGLTINQTKALALPGACNVKTPPLSQCNGRSIFYRQHRQKPRQRHRAVPLYRPLRPLRRLRGHLHLLSHLHHQTPVLLLQGKDQILSLLRPGNLQMEPLITDR